MNELSKKFGFRIPVLESYMKGPGDFSVLVLSGCLANWVGDDVDQPKEERHGSWIVRTLGGEELDPKLMESDWQLKGATGNMVILFSP